VAGAGSHRPVSGPRRILIRLPNWLGDVLMARPLLHGIRRAHPHAEIRAVGKSALLALVEHERTFDAGEPWPARGDLSPLAFRTEREQLEADLASWRPDVALVLPFSFSSAWFAFTLRAPMRIGYAHELRSPLLTHALERPARGERHLSREYLALGEPIGVTPGPLPELVPPLEADAAASALIGRVAPGADRFAVMAPRSAYGPAREWPADRFAALARLLAGRGLAVVLCGTAAERETCRQVSESAGSGVVSAAGETDLPTLAALVRRAAIAVCNDSGLAHLAGAVGTPTVTLYGSTSSAWTAALGPRVRVVQHPPVCSPCFRRTCRIGYHCLTGLSLDEVDGVCREVGA
jgi:lipopolysaccharide heptosyltransferase II